MNLLKRFLNYASKQRNEDLDLFLGVDLKEKKNGYLNEMNNFLKIISNKGLENKNKTKNNSILLS